MSDSKAPDAEDRVRVSARGLVHSKFLTWLSY